MEHFSAHELAECDKRELGTLLIHRLSQNVIWWMGAKSVRLHIATHKWKSVYRLKARRLCSPNKSRHEHMTPASCEREKHFRIHKCKKNEPTLKRGHSAPLPVGLLSSNQACVTIFLGWKLKANSVELEHEWTERTFGPNRGRACVLLICWKVLCVSSSLFPLYWSQSQSMVGNLPAVRIWAFWRHGMEWMAGKWEGGSTKAERGTVAWSVQFIQSSKVFQDARVIIKVCRERLKVTKSNESKKIGGKGERQSNE